MKVTDEQRKMVSAMCEAGVFTDDLSDCEWCREYCHKDTKEIKLNPQQQYMENLISRVESARKEFREAIKKEFERIG